MNTLQKKEKYTAFDYILIVLMIVLAIIVIYPLLYGAVVSLSGKEAVNRGEVNLIPKAVTLKAFEFIITSNMFWRSVWNSVKQTVGSTALTLVLTALFVYPLTIKEFRYRKFLNVFITVTLFLNPGMIPQFLLRKDLHLLNTAWVIILPGAVSAFNVFLLRNAFDAVPHALIDSATIDGAGHLTILSKIMLPLTKSTLMTIAMFTVVTKWNDYYTALLYLTDPKVQPVTLLIQQLTKTDVSHKFMSSLQTELYTKQVLEIVSPQSITMAGMVLMALPMLVLYPFVMKYYVQGVALGGVKE